CVPGRVQELQRAGPGTERDVSSAATGGESADHRPAERRLGRGPRHLRRQPWTGPDQHNGHEMGLSALAHQARLLAGTIPADGRRDPLHVVPGAERHHRPGSVAHEMTIRTRSWSAAGPNRTSVHGLGTSDPRLYEVVAMQEGVKP